ncbi:hypothetical protein [Cellulosilyticum ruminicola]|uniref:hypothetical protein n=1 Tax=Cellulosilyticum ruminicola TaxID=425254 RepID=UPI000B0EC7F5|nr:hypothetical protein [Cellulosilyticum ruminicola]
MAEFTTLGAVIWLLIAIVLIIKKVHPAYSLILGALAGGNNRISNNYLQKA